MSKIADILKKPRIAPIVAIAVLFLAAGTVFYHHIESLSWLDSLFFCVMTLTTVGYAQVPIATDAGKIFTIFYAIFGVVILASAANYLVHAALVKREAWHGKTHTKE